MEDDDNWGLQAVVRSCCGAVAASSSSASCSSSSTSALAAAGWTAPSFRLPASWNPPLIAEEDEAGGILGDLQLHYPSGLCSTAASYDLGDHPLGELEDLFRPFFPKPEPQHDLPTTPPPPPQQKPVAKEERSISPSHHPPPPPFSTPSPFASATGVDDLAAKQTLASRQQPRPRGMCQNNANNARSKRRKNQVKKVVCQVPADALCSDIWAWRKYGQKPIKGSPFPRGYYRCSSSKGCPARKQVERSRTDSGMFVITYTSDHNHPVPTHRSCLAGSTRHKSPPPQAQPQPTTCSSTTTFLSDAARAAGSSCGVKPSVSCSPLSSVEDELLLPLVPDEVVMDMGPAAAAGVDSDTSDHDDGLLVVRGGMDVDDMLGGVEEEEGADVDGDSDGMMLMFSAPGFCGTPPAYTPPGPEDRVCSWTDDHGNAVPFAAVSR